MVTAQTTAVSLHKHPSMRYLQHPSTAVHPLSLSRRQDWNTTAPLTSLSSMASSISARDISSSSFLASASRSSHGIVSSNSASSAFCSAFTRVAAIASLSSSALHRAWRWGKNQSQTSSICISTPVFSLCFTFNSGENRHSQDYTPLPFLLTNVHTKTKLYSEPSTRMMKLVQWKPCWKTIPMRDHFL